MRTIRRSSSLMDRLPDPVRDFLSRRASEMVGLALLALMAAVALSLATWSVDDPSLNNATSGAVANWLGRPGAMVADLLMQLIGLGVIALLFPPLVWSLRLVRFHIFDRGALKLGLWIVAVAATAAVGSALPATPRWPLPTGMGGVIGDGLLFGTRNLAGIAGNAVGGLVGFLYAGIAILAVTAAAGFGFVGDEDPALDEDEADESWSESEDRRDDEPGIAVILVGWLAHGAMALRGMILRRLPQAPRVATQGAGSSGTGRSGLEPVAAAGRVRREPQFDDGTGRKAGPRPETPFDPAPLPPLRGPRAAPADDAPFDLDDDEPLDLRDLNAPRVSAPAPGPKPGKRIQREAQPSLLDRDEFELPPLTYLGEPKKLPASAVSTDALEQNATLLEGVLEDFGVRGEITQVRPGPVVTLYELEPAPGTKSSRVISLADDIARSMSAISARVAVIPGKNAIGIELPNAKRETVYLRELLASQDFESSKHKLALGLGKTIGGEPVIVDLAKMPHLLVAGTTGSGKSVAINTMILSLLYRLKPEQCRLIMVDPKMLELSVYDGIPHLLTPVVTDPKKAVVALKWAVREMEERYKKMSKLSVRNIDGFNARVQEAAAAGEVITRTVQTGFDRHSGEAIYEDEVMDLEPLPYIVVIVDEMADLMMVAGKEIEGTIQRLAQMARAAGIHVVLATQRPSVDVITGTIKANFPTRISFQVTSKIDSRTILGEMGAEQLLGQGDMLYMAGGGRITRVHGPFVSDAEVEKVVAHLKTQGRPQYLDAVTSEEDEPGPEAEDGAVFDKTGMGQSESEDPYEQAVAVVLRDKKASTSYIQRRLQIGYNRAASIMERMENEGIVGPANHAGKREILVETGRAREDED
ncbi:DNA translocase FtsK [Bosea sp. (in: a-proteobacteria)]|nr:DNA translocase FtsK [Bosea sp. (in: a-proteobacteria)]MDP3257056.1 DNA translocase FtsK [Bosea sp. (in: a-proteobacteria)]